MKSPFVIFAMLIVGVLAVACSAILLFVNMESVDSFKSFIRLCVSICFLFVTGRYLICVALMWHDEIKSKN